MPKDKELIVALLTEVRNDQKKHSTILVNLKNDVKRNADDLEEHMAQTRAVKSLVLTHKEIADKLNKSAENRFKRLEKPLDFLCSIKKILLGLGAVAGSVYGIMKLIEILP